MLRSIVPFRVNHSRRFVQAALSVSMPVFLAAMAVQAAIPVAVGAERIDGPVTADIVEVIDGDSLRVNARVWPGHRVTVNVRLRGIDAPELRSACEREQRLAAAARQALGRRVGSGRVVLTNISGGKYYGRVLADVGLADGSDVATFMKENAPVRAYRGGRRAKWCR